MSKRFILLMILLGSVMAQNPDGKPFTLSLTTDVFQIQKNTTDGLTSQAQFFLGQGYDDKKDDLNFHISWKMPISNYVTLSGYHRLMEHNYTALDLDGNQLDKVAKNNFSTLSVTCHIPLYKLWEN